VQKDIEFSVINTNSQTDSREDTISAPVISHGRTGRERTEDEEWIFHPGVGRR
jgi:hypothetical protein